MAFTFTINGHEYTSDSANVTAAEGYRFIGYGYVTALANLAVDLVAVVADAAASAVAAAASAASAVNAPGTSATSASAMTVGLGAQGLTIQAGKSIVVGMSVKIAYTASPTTWMHGDVTAYNSGTGALTVNVTSLNGSGTYSSWTVSLSAPMNMVGTGGATASGSFTLNPGSAYVQRVTPTAHGQACTAAAASSFTKGPIISLFNASDYDYAFKDSTGVIRAFIPPWEACDIGLADNSTAAGVWTFSNYNLLGVTASTSRNNTDSSEGGNTTLRFVSLDSDRSMLLYGTTICYARVLRKSTGAWAAPVMVRSGSGLVLRFRAVKCGTDKVLVVSCRETSTDMEAVVLSVNSSTDVITPGTAAPTTLAGTLATLGELIATTTYFAIAYGRATNVCALRGLSVSGTTPAFTAEQTLSAVANTAPAILSYSAGEVFMAFACDANNAVFCYPVTLGAGPGLTLGTSAWIATNSLSGQFRVLRMSSTKWHLLMRKPATNFLLGGIVTLAGTVAAESHADLSATVTDEPVQYADIIAVSATKSCIAYGASGGNVVYFNHLIDTAGTASAGTELTYACTTIAADNFAAISVSGSTCKFASANNSSANVTLYTIDSSGTSPQAIDLRESGGTSSTPNQPALVYPTARDGSIDPATAISTAGTIRIAPAKGATGGMMYGGTITTVPPVHIPLRGSYSKGDTTVVKGLTSAESWFYRQGPSGGIQQLVKVEAAQP